MKWGFSESRGRWSRHKGRRPSLLSFSPVNFQRLPSMLCDGQQAQQEHVSRLGNVALLSLCARVACMCFYVYVYIHTYT